MKITNANLPVKVLQFGTGVLLRGLPDYLIHQANMAGLFGGSIIIVKSTSTGLSDDFAAQDNQYTVMTRGILDGKVIEENTLCTAVAGVISAQSGWDEILLQAYNPDLQLVLSNTTEVGIQLLEESIHASPPKSFPAKLLAVLYKRYHAFLGDQKRGLVIIPTELIPNNAHILKDILVTLAQHNQLEPEFIEWLTTANKFCNSLVDRIVPGKPDKAQREEFEKQSGYIDNLLLVAEPYLLWAIEADDEVKKIISFEAIHPGIVVCDDITKFIELKLRLLNATHSLTCAVAYFAGFNQVNNAMNDPDITEFTTSLMHEISEVIPYPLEDGEAEAYSARVLDRFRNPFIQHQWLSIGQQYTTKMKMRVVPLLVSHFQQFQVIPRSIVKGFAAYLLFMKTEQTAHGYEGQRGAEHYPVADDFAAYFCDAWKTVEFQKLASKVLSEVHIWGTDLTEFPGFADAIQEELNNLLANEHENI